MRHTAILTEWIDRVITLEEVWDYLYASDNTDRKQATRAERVSLVHTISRIKTDHQITNAMVTERMCEIDAAKRQTMIHRLNATK